MIHSYEKNVLFRMKIEQNMSVGKYSKLLTRLGTILFLAFLFVFVHEFYFGLFLIFHIFSPVKTKYLGYFG